MGNEIQKEAKSGRINKCYRNGQKEKPEGREGRDAEKDESRKVTVQKMPDGIQTRMKSGRINR